jgi:flagellar hook-length control protein FliK
LEIKLPNSLSLSSQNDDPLQFKIGQKIDVKVISALADKNAIEISMAGKIIEARSNQTIAVGPGQAMKLQVIKTFPAPELEILEPLTQFIAATAQRKSAAPQPAILTLIVHQATTKGSQQAINIQGAALQTGQQITAKVTNIIKNKIQLQLIPEKLTAAVDANLDGKATYSEKPFISENPELEIKVNSVLGRKLKVGQQIQLHVLKTNPEPAFKIISIDNQENMPQALRRLMPMQESTSVLINQLMQDLPKISASEQLPETLKRLARLIIQNLPGKEQLKSSSELQQAVKNSGLFLEAKMTGSQDLSADQFRGDFKADLFKLLQSLKQPLISKSEKPADMDLTLMKDLQQKTEGSLAKLILDQLVSTPKEDSPKQIWSLEIPFIDKGKAESIKLEIEKENHNQQQAENPNWSVTIHITPPNLGAIHCKLAYYNNALQTHFWSEQATTVSLIKENLAFLKNQMQEAGIDPGKIDVHEGFPAAPEQSHKSGVHLFQGEA